MPVDDPAGKLPLTRIENPMPGKIKALWYLCIVVIITGFIMLAAKDKMDEAREHSESTYKVATEEKKKIDEKTVQIDPVKLVR